MQTEASLAVYLLSALCAPKIESLGRAEIFFPSNAHTMRWHRRDLYVKHCPCVCVCAPLNEEFFPCDRLFVHCCGAVLPWCTSLCQMRYLQCAQTHRGQRKYCNLVLHENGCVETSILARLGNLVIDCSRLVIVLKGFALYILCFLDNN